MSYLYTNKPSIFMTCFSFHLISPDCVNYHYIRRTQTFYYITRICYQQTDMSPSKIIIKNMCPLLYPIILECKLYNVYRHKFLKYVLRYLLLVTVKYLFLFVGGKVFVDFMCQPIFTNFKNLTIM